MEHKNITEKIVEKISDSGIKVTVHIPDSVPEAVRQQKINQIYNILTKPKNKN